MSEPDAGTIALTPIGTIRSPFKERFGIPRQAGLAPAAAGVVELFPPFAIAEAVRGLEGFSHIWVVSLLHQRHASEWHPTVRPPRLGGNQRVGVFASRSPYRPNPLGLSVVRLDRIEIEGSGVRLHVAGLDLLDGTPVLDIKPYIPYADALADAHGGFAATRPRPLLNVEFSPEAREQVLSAGGDTAKAGTLEDLVVELLRLDPRPAYHRNGSTPRQSYAMRVAEVDVAWIVEDERVIVQRITPI